MPIAEPESLPQSKQFEALSHELFSLTNTSVDNDALGQDQLFNTALQAYLNPEAAMQTQSVTLPQATLQDNGTAGIDPFSFFDIATNNARSDSDTLQGYTWSGPSLSDMFDVGLQ